jgi:phosphate butyryltransferase
MNIGENLRKYMAMKNVSRERIASVLGYDDVKLEQLFDGDFSPEVSELLKLVTLLKTDIPALLYGKEYTEKKAIRTPPDGRVIIKKEGTIDYECLSPTYSGRKMEPLLVTIYRKDPKSVDVSRHEGQEFLFITEGRLSITVDGTEYILEEGDTFYFDSALPHAVNSITEKTRMVAAIYKSDSMVDQTRGRSMKAIIEAAKLSVLKNIVVVCPDETTLSAVNRAIHEQIIGRAFLVGNIEKTKALCGDAIKYPDRYEYVDIRAEGDDYERAASVKAVEIVKQKKAHMIMKGKINTSAYVKAILDRKNGIGTGRRLSLVGIFEIPGVDRLIMLTDPGINPELFTGDKADSGLDIINNAIDVARSLGVSRPKIAILDANEVPTASIPSTVHAKTLSDREWTDADVYGPLSYDIALYEEFADKKGFVDHPVAGRADILVVPFIVSGNILYKSWVMTMGAEVANVVLGAQVPVILTSRSDTDMVKFLTLCASVLYSNYLEKGPA